MGNSNTKRSEESLSSTIRKKNKEFVDRPINYGCLVTQGIYTAKPEYDIDVVRGFILKKKLSPFYKGMESYSDNPFPGALTSSDNLKNTVLDETLKQNPDSLNDNSESVNNSESDSQTLRKKIYRRSTASTSDARRSRHNSFSSMKGGKNVLNNGNRSDNEDSLISPTSSSHTPKVDAEHPIYSKEEFFKFPIECPICFLYYPRNINYTRCCDQPICTECFIQIKRTFSNPEPTCCPYCVQPNFGVTYLSPDSEEYQKQYEILIKAKEQHNPEYEKLLSQGSTPGKKRRSSISHTDPHIVTSDDIYPGWMLKYEQYQREQRRLEAMRVRNFNAQVNNSATVALLDALLQIPTNENNILNRNGNSIRTLGSDLEELMLLEAIRRSLADSSSPTEDVEPVNLSVIEENNSNVNDNTSNISITNEPEEPTENIIDPDSPVNINNNDNNIVNDTANDTSNDVTNDNANTDDDNPNTITDITTNDNDNNTPEETGNNSEKVIINNNNNNNNDNSNDNNIELSDNTINDNIETNIINSTSTPVDS
ncbi:hypothetical protein BCR32DRAFT_266457 [Anaeromyces robustus]|jgi:hypothetical protein|uniref:RING-type domain-containing protein n=1 Tax=Anaeromyces robustus TaxID=1754192 RepID=A0A1Y1XEU3_9FUNG|nr:hypothetical protein BCR32DRAFT_266457 [Anaeromyces robustus]|eukprot:ORX84243.1 hypothetical protein BCR32DRAFT_266457 [Anaeromyces robustus]